MGKTQVGGAIAKQGPNNSKRGFASHPENINKAGRPSAGMAHAEWLRANLFDVPIRFNAEDKLPLPILKRIRELPTAIKGRVKTYGNLGDAMDFMDWLMGDATKGTVLKDRGYGKCPQPITGEDGGPLQVQTVVQFVGCGVKASPD
jgi:hypothetical protein